MFALLRVISWIARLAEVKTIHEITRTNTKNVDLKMQHFKLKTNHHEDTEQRIQHKVSL